MINGEYNINETKKSGWKIIGLIVLFFIVLFAVGLIYYFTKINKGASEQSVPISMTVEKGMSTGEIAAVLREKNIIRNPRVFLIYTILHNASGKIQAGDYMLDRKMSIIEIVDILTAGKVTRQDKKVTILEGWSNKLIGENLEKRGIDTAANFNTALQANYDFKFSDVAANLKFEGFLYPDTYELTKDGGSTELIQEALKNFESKITDEMISDITERKMSIEDIITLASIIEREVGRSSDVKLSDEVLGTMQRERELVASVFYNRLEINMALQSDATVNYATGRSDRRARAEDLVVNSPYNTYKFPGLPPGPISNPSLGAIKAAIYPAETDYLYFLNSIEGTAYFGKNLEEHNSNRVKYLD